LAEKRAILASWASDASAIASCPALRAPDGVKAPVTFDEILDALCELDGKPRNPPGGKPFRLRSTGRALAAWNCCLETKSSLGLPPKHKSPPAGLMAGFLTSPI
jgi:hypothetical protein